MPECVMLMALAKILAGKNLFSAGPKQDSLPHPTPHPSTIKAPPKSKN